MMYFKLWLVENSTKGKNQLATLVQQGVGAGDRSAWTALLDIVKEKNEMQLQSLRQIVSGYLKHDGKAGAAARYLMNTIQDMDNESDQAHYTEKAQEAVNIVTETLRKVGVPQSLADEFLDLIEKEANTPTFFMSRHHMGNQFMAKALPFLVKIAEHLFAAQGEQEAKYSMIEILGDMTRFAEHVPTLQMVINRIHRGG